MKDWLGESVTIKGVRSLHGGSISTALLLNLDRRPPVVLKISPHTVVRQYEHEAYQLNLLRDWGLPAPEVYACQVASLERPHSYLLMEQMPGRPMSDVRESLSREEMDHLQMHIADLVLSLHGRTSLTYRRVSDGGEPGTRDFTEFFHSIYDAIVSDVIAMKLMPPSQRRRITNIHDKVAPLLEHTDRPRLVHGDLWSSNLMVEKDTQGRWWVTGVLDPNFRYSHAELELAYMELFRTVTPAFFRVYEQTQRLSSEYKVYRRDVYMLYTLLNHVRLFGQQYVKPLAAMAEKVALHVSAKRSRARLAS